MICIAAKIDGAGNVARYNCVETEAEAKAAVNRLIGATLTDAERADLEAQFTDAAKVQAAFDSGFHVVIQAVRQENAHLTDGQWLHFTNRLYKPLPLEKQQPDAFYATASTDAETAEFEREPTFWVADPANKSVAVDKAKIEHSFRMRRKEEALHEAEKRETAGTEVNGVKVATDPDGISKLHGLMVKAQRTEAAGNPVDIRGRTRAGEKIAITSATEAEGLFDAASAHVSRVQAKLDDLMGNIDAMPLADLKYLDVSDDVHWA